MIDQFREVLDFNMKQGWIKNWGFQPVSLSRPNTVKNYVIILLDKTRIVGKPVNGSNQNVFLIKSEGFIFAFSKTEEPRLRCLNP